MLLECANRHKLKQATSVKKWAGGMDKLGNVQLVTSNPIVHFQLIMEKMNISVSISMETIMRSGDVTLDQAIPLIWYVEISIKAHSKILQKLPLIGTMKDIT